MQDHTDSNAAWLAVFEALLRRAAALGAEHGVEPDAFMAAAWAACLDARPVLREQLEDMQLAARLDELRGRGLIGEA